MAKIATTFEDTKFRLHNAYRAAKRADKLSGALFDRWMSEALMHAKGQPVERATAMLFRTAVILEIAAERKGGRTASWGCQIEKRGRRGPKLMPCSPRSGRGVIRGVTARRQL